MKITIIIFAAFISNFAQATNVAFQKQYQSSIQHLIENILPNGAVIASPSKVEPDYYYDWVRDTSLTMKLVVELAYDPKVQKSLRSKLNQKIENWLEWELARQNTYKLTDLGEPKFYVNGKANLEPWGRPQNDGPALRAQTAILFASHLIQEGKFELVKNKLYRSELPAHTLIKRDLEYIAHHWQETSFDLWEEERAMHYYTLVSQRAALIKGARLAKTLNDPSAADFYLTQANGIKNYLENFYDPTQRIIKYAINKVQPLPHKKSDLDVAVLLAAIQTYDGNFYVDVPKVILTVKKTAQTFLDLYKINQNKKSAQGSDLGVAMGRYPDDRYSGYDFSSGNPWFISTLALAEFACQLKGANYEQTAIKQFNRVIFHLKADGSLSEQFNRDQGFQQGAHDLTWSYSAYISAYRACF